MKDDPNWTGNFNRNIFRSHDIHDANSKVINYLTPFDKFGNQPLLLSSPASRTSCTQLFATQSDCAEWIRWLRIMLPSPHFPGQHHQTRMKSKALPSSVAYSSLIIPYTYSTNCVTHYSQLKRWKLCRCPRHVVVGGDWRPAGIWIAEILPAALNQRLLQSWLLSKEYYLLTWLT